jgi:arylsulfatase A-like enzyme/Tfp pilus assembly protein PilF
MVRLAIGAVTLAFLGCGSLSLSAGRKPNVLLVTIDTLRADRIGAYGYRAAETPHLDALAAEGVVFESAFTHSPVTLSSHATLLTGRLPFQHGVRSNSLYQLPEEEVTLAEILRAAGYHTAAFVSAAALDRRFQLTQGFATYDDDVNAVRDGGLIAERSAAEVSGRATAWLEKAEATRPFFLWVHFFDPHHPYAPPEPYRSRFASSPYDGEIAYCDREVGRLIERLKRMGAVDDTIVVVASDHGEGLGEHGEQTHGIFVYDSTLRVPLIMAGPGIPKGARDGRRPVGLVDVLPTVLGRLGLSTEAASSGRDLFREEPAPFLYAETYLTRDFYRWSPLQALRSERYKLIKAPKPELYDLGADPVEERNLVDEEAGMADQIGSRLEALLAASEGKDGSYQPDPVLLSRLQSLGYLGRQLPDDPGPHFGFPDPKDKVAIVAELDEAFGYIGRAQYELAEKKLREILESDPENFLATTYLADALFELSKNREAIEAYRAATEKGRDTAYYRFRLGILHERLGLYDRAAEEFRQAVGRNPEAAREVLERAKELLDRKEVDGALHYLNMLEQQGSGGPALALLFAAAWHAKGDAARALASFEAALAELEDPEEKLKLLKTVGALYGELGRYERAVEYFREASTLSPGDFEAQANLGVTLARAGEWSAALEPLATALEIRPSEVRLINLKAEIHFRRGELEQSRDLLRRSLAIHPDQPPIVRALAEVEEKIGAPKE